MGRSFFDLGIPEHLPIRDVVWDYCRVEINDKGIDAIFEELQINYIERRGNLQPTYAQFSSYRLYLRYQYFKKKILELPNWSDAEVKYWEQSQTFKLN
jgi:hypothetical protein